MDRSVAGWSRLIPPHKAKQLDVDPSFVSKVASGARNSEKVTHALEMEMKRWGS